MDQLAALLNAAAEAAERELAERDAEPDTEPHTSGTLTFEVPNTRKKGL